jgi:serine/threonine protein phosphatase PrpC
VQGGGGGGGAFVQGGGGGGGGGGGTQQADRKKPYITTGFSGIPNPTKTSFQFKGPGIEDQANYGQDSVGYAEVINDVFHLTLIIECDGHGAQPGGLQWSGMAVKTLKKNLLDEKLFGDYLLEDDQQEIIKKRLEQTIHESIHQVYQEIISVPYVDHSGSTMAISLIFYYFQGPLHKKIRIININLGDSAFLNVQLNPQGLIKDAKASRYDSWDTVENFQEYYDDFIEYQAKYPADHPILQHPRVQSSQWWHIYTLQAGKAIINHHNILKHTHDIYNRFSGSIGGNQVSANRRMVAFRDGQMQGLDIPRPAFNNINKYRIYAIIDVVKKEIDYIATSDYGARSDHGQFRSSFGDIDGLEKSGILNRPKITFNTLSGKDPLAVIVMSDGIGDIETDPVMANLLASGLRRRITGEEMAIQMVQHIGPIAHHNYHKHDDISCVVAMIYPPQQQTRRFNKGVQGLMVPYIKMSGESDYDRGVRIIKDKESKKIKIPTKKLELEENIKNHFRKNPFGRRVFDVDTEEGYFKCFVYAHNIYIINDRKIYKIIN